VIRPSFDRTSFSSFFFQIKKKDAVPLFERIFEKIPFSNKNLSLLIQKSKCRSLRLNVTVISKSPKKQTKKLNKIPKSTLVSPFFYRFLP